jgi:hypothetical protein
VLPGYSVRYMVEVVRTKIWDVGGVEETRSSSHFSPPHLEGRLDTRLLCWQEFPWGKQTLVVSWPWRGLALRGGVTCEGTCYLGLLMELLDCQAAKERSAYLLAIPAPLPLALHPAYACHISSLDCTLWRQC